MTFGEKLQTLRQKAGMSQDALAEKLDVSRQAVSRWERDETMPETEKVIALADLFGVTTDYLLRHQPEPEMKQEPPRPEQRSSRDFIDRAAYFAKTKGYLLGWVLVVWGALDLITLLLMTMGVIGFLGFGERNLRMGTAEWIGTGVGTFLLIPALYAVLKIAAGVLVLHYGRQYAKKVEEEER